MNLEEIKELRKRFVIGWAVDAQMLSAWDWLITKVERLRAENYQAYHPDEINYQRRHRKWALKQCRTWARHFCFYKDDAVRFHSDRADKAEAALEKEIEAAEFWRVRYEEQKIRAKELESLFALQQIRMCKAVKMWQGAMGKHETLPDLGDLLDWLMGVIEAHEEEITDLQILRLLK